MFGWLRVDLPGQRLVSAIEIDMGNGFVAMGTGSARSDASTEDIAFRASANAEVAALAAGTLIDDLRPPGLGFGYSSFDAMAGPVGRLAATIAVELAPSRGGKRSGAPRADDNTHIVTLS